jgi:hypothetical protein
MLYKQALEGKWIVHNCSVSADWSDLPSHHLMGSTLLICLSQNWIDFVWVIHSEFFDVYEYHCGFLESFLEELDINEAQNIIE